MSVSRVFFLNKSLRYGLKFTSSTIRVGVLKFYLFVNIFLKNCFIVYELKIALTKTGILFNKLLEDTVERAAS